MWTSWHILNWHLPHGPKNAGHIRVEFGFDPDNTYHMHKSTPDTEAGQTLLTTKGWIQVKDGRQWGKGQQAYLVLAHQSLSILAASIMRLKWSTPLWPAASPNIFAYRDKYSQPHEPPYDFYYILAKRMHLSWNQKNGSSVLVTCECHFAEYQSSS